MLKNASKDYFYKIYVMQTEISAKHKEILFNIVEQFDNASLDFIDMEGKFEHYCKDSFDKTCAKAYFSKEMYYKLITPEIFPQYDKIILSDVDVLYLGDISQIYNDFDINENYYFSAKERIDDIDKRMKEYTLYWHKKIIKQYTLEEIEKLRYGAGIMVYNHKKMREDNIQQKLLEFLSQNTQKVYFPEQDTLTFVCYPYIKPMAINSMVTAPEYKYYRERLNETYKNKEIIEKMLDNPIQLHYSSKDKPWHTLCEKADLWYNYLTKTPMFSELMEKLLKKEKKKILLTLKTPIIKRKFSLTKEYI